MKLLELEGMTGVPSPHLSTVYPFDKIIERDSSEDKRETARELAYIHFYVHHESPYAQYPKERRGRKVAKDVFEDEDWEPDELIQEGIDKYKELTQSEYIRLLNGARSAANKLIDYFDQLDLNETDKNDKLKYSAKDVINNISKIGDVVEGMDKLKEQIKKHESRKNDNRAGVETNKYSEG